MNNIVNVLSDELLKQPFDEATNPATPLVHCQYIAQMYARLENAVAVLSDLKNNKSYIYNGGIAATLGLHDKFSTEIHSIWEEAIFKRIHPEDLLQKHLLELQYFHFLRSIPVKDRNHYHVISRLRMRDGADRYIKVLHRMFYLHNSPNGSIWLALCLYNHSYLPSISEAYEGCIVDTITGQVIQSEKQGHHNILSKREIEILGYIKTGKRSKEIADLLSISINTVNRHRQNILEKLRVGNSMEACRIATSLNWLA